MHITKHKDIYLSTYCSYRKKCPASNKKLSQTQTKEEKMTCLQQIGNEQKKTQGGPLLWNHQAKILK